jgi:N-acylneuraminate cytidylyltransferase
MHTKLEILAIIPARGGSKSIPQKNLVPVYGQPLLWYSIKSAMMTSTIDRIVVSTDDHQIATKARHYGAEIVNRSKDISGDNASSESALLHVLDHLKDQEHYQPDLVVFLQATSPMRNPDDIQNAIDTLIAQNADSLFSACKVEGFIWCSSTNKLVPINYDPSSRPTRQKLEEEILEENGSIYIFKPWVLRKFNSRMGGKITVYRMGRLQSFQIDTYDDVKVIEQIMAFNKSTPSPEKLADIRLLVLDFDGVMTDNRALVDQEGKESVVVHRGDGWGIARLKEAGVKQIVISTEKNPVVSVRCHKLGVEYIQGCENKLSALKAFAEKTNLSQSQIAYVGNDINDLDCMRWVGVPIAVKNAAPEVLSASSLVTDRIGGDGAVRQVSDWILLAKSSTNLNEETSRE